jgi:hypothetical protein
MARILSKIDEWEVYIPNIGSERAGYQEDPENALTMEIRLLTKKERERFHHFLQQATNDKNRSQQERAEREIITILDSAVRDVKNYVVGDECITSGRRLWEVADEVGDLALIADVTSAICQLSALDAGLGKRLAPRSDGSISRRSSSAGGGAHIVTSQSNPGARVTSIPTIPSSCSTTSTNEGLEIVTMNLE